MVVFQDSCAPKRRKEKVMIAAPSRKPNTVTPRPIWGMSMSTATSPRLPNSTTCIDKSCSVRLPPPAPRPERRSRRPPTIEPMMSGMARAMLMMPPAATAPAPM